MEIQYYTILNSNKLSGLIGYYSFISIVSIGIIFNFISLIIFTRPKLNANTNMGYLFSILVLSHNFTLIYYLFITKPTTLFNYSMNYCGLISLLKLERFSLTIWIQVLISIERLLCIYNKKKLPTRKLLNIILFIIITIVLLANSTDLFFDSIKNNSTNNATSHSCDSKEHIFKIHKINFRSN